MESGPVTQKYSVPESFFTVAKPSRRKQLGPLFTKRIFERRSKPTAPLYAIRFGTLTEYVSRAKHSFCAVTLLEKQVRRI